jgi:hypothetical protein
MASKMTFHESYGDVTVAELRAIKKHNVSPSDHTDLQEIIGEKNHAEITRAIIELTAENGGFYNPLHRDIVEWWRGES